MLGPGGRLVSVAAQPAQEAAAARGIMAIYFVVEPNREQLVELARLAGHRPGKIVLRVADGDKDAAASG